MQLCELPTTSAGYAALLGWLRSFGLLIVVGSRNLDHFDAARAHRVVGDFLRDQPAGGWSTSRGGTARGTTG